MTEFRYERAFGSGILVAAYLGGEHAGSVTVRGQGAGQVAIGRLNTSSGFRRQGVARALMEHVLWLYCGAEAWLYADPYIPRGEEPGPPREVLEAFYASLGFVRAAKCPELGLMVRPARLTAGERSR